MAEEKKAEEKKADEKNKYSLDYLVVASAAFLVVGLLAGMYAFPQGGATGTATPGGFVTVSKEKAGEDSVAFVNKNIIVPQGGTMSLKGTKDYNGFFYQVDFEIEGGGNTMPGSFFVTMDGRFVAPSLIDTTVQAETPADNGGITDELVKSDKPVVDVFVFSYCPYGLQVEKGLFPVVELLADKADITVRQIGAMHGMHEELEAKRQLCLREEQPETLYAYMSAFAASADISACQDKFYSPTEFNGDEAKMEACVAPFITKMMADAGVDSAKLETCMQGKAQEYYDSDMAYAAGYSVGSSPTMVINGTAVKSDRDSESIKKAICFAFNTTPEECNTALSSTAPAAGFGSGASSGSGGSC
ncbi:MAG: hypothetical protein V1676_04680 [Candidatus Diapherotrites archaeon]